MASANPGITIGSLTSATEEFSLSKCLEDLLSEDLETSRKAKREIREVVHFSGRPGAETERAAVEKSLLGFLGTGAPDTAKVDILWMLSAIASDESVSEIAKLLSEEGLREDARMTLERIPGEASLNALKEAFDKVPQDFKPNLVQSLRARGVEVDGYPCLKLEPTKQTQVQPIK